MDKKLKKQLLDMLQDISYAHEDGSFWNAWSKMHKFLWDMPEDEKMKFHSVEEMRQALQEGDLYCERTNEYVFTYNDGGSICIYTIPLDEAYKLEKMAREDDEYWGAYLGVGGDIYDDEDAEYKMATDLILGEWEFTRDLFKFEEE